MVSVAPMSISVADDDLPLPSFIEIFGDGFTALNKSKKRRSGKDAGEETKG